MGRGAARGGRMGGLEVDSDPAEPGDGSARGRLFIVATPIGNLRDVTLRALDVLRDVPLVAAEDTRITRRLFDRHGLATPLASFHARNVASRLPGLLEHLRSGRDLALVTDAGTPSVSDPGDDLVSAWIAEGGPVVPIPGPSAILAAVVGSGIAGPRWSFEGFLPRSGRERRARLSRIAADPRATIIFEAPGRVAGTLADLAAACGDERPGAVCRELTKVHEEFVRGPLGRLAAAAAGGELTLRGEFVLVVGTVGAARTGGPTPAAARPRGGQGAGRPGLGTADGIDLALAEVDRLVAAGHRRGEAVRMVADATGLPRRRLYVAGPPGRDDRAGDERSG